MTEKPSVKMHSAKYFGLTGLGGLMACGFTHCALTPVDNVKCRMQTGAAYKGTIDGLRTIWGTNRREFVRGWAPTFWGYSFQGIFKFGGYEVFKYMYLGMLSEKMKKSEAVKTMVYMGASASAEFVADIALCPFEAVKVRIQTSKPGTFPTNMRKGLPHIFKEGGLGYVYKGLVPLWTRQIPYTIIKFTTFERFVGMLYKHVFTKGRENYTKTQQLGVSFIGGYMAGVFCAIVSHPPDVVVSKLNQNPGAGMIETAKKLGFKGCWTGLAPRIFMIGTLTALQWYIYDSFKVYNRFPTSGGH